MTKVFLPLYNDRVFIDIFGNIKNIKYIEYFLECLLGLREYSLRNNVQIRFQNNKNEFNCCELIYIVNRTLVNIECYKNFDKSSFLKSYTYFSILSNEALNNNIYSNFVQFNLIKNANMALQQKFSNELIERPLQNLMRMNNIRLDNLNSFVYDKNNIRIMDLIIFLRFINAESGEERRKIAKGRKILMELNRVVEKYELDNLRKEDFYFSKNEKEASYRIGYSDGVEKGEQNGIKIGRRQSVLDIAKKMLYNNMKMEEIQAYTNLTKEDIRRLI